MDMLFSLKSCFLGPCRKALEWEIQWIIYWNDWVRYVTTVYFKTVQNRAVNSSSLMWFSAYSGFSVSKNQNWEYVLKWMLECFPVFWHAVSFMSSWSSRLGECSCSVFSDWPGTGKHSALPVASRVVHNGGRTARKTSCGKSKHSGKESLDLECSCGLLSQATWEDMQWRILSVGCQGRIAQEVL